MESPSCSERGRLLCAGDGDRRYATPPAEPRARVRVPRGSPHHWRLSRGFAELGALDGDLSGGRLRIVGPLGLSRVARTRVTGAEPPRWVAGRAEIGPTTVGSVRWTIDPD